MATTSIQWTQQVWNPVAGCSLASPGCTHCYAMRMAARLEAMGQEKYDGLTVKRNGATVWTGKINLVPEALDLPLRRRKPTTWFVNSMSDLFHPDVPFDFVDKVFGVMALTPHHTYQVLTKRPERMAEYVATIRKQSNGVDLSDRDPPEALPRRIWRQLPATGWPESGFNLWPLRNVWTGFSAENQEWFDKRWPHARELARAGWLTWTSMEPLIGPVVLPPDALWAGSGLKWVVVGGESGPGARPCNVAWVQSIRDQCQAAGVACFVKQLGAKVCGEGKDWHDWRAILKDKKGGDWTEWPEDLRVRQFPAGSKQAAIV
jgi:protein gp37